MPQILNWTIQSSNSITSFSSKFLVALIEKKMYDDLQRRQQQPDVQFLTFSLYSLQIIKDLFCFSSMPGRSCRVLVCKLSHSLRNQASRNTNWGLHFRWRKSFPDLAPSNSKLTLTSTSNKTLVSVMMHLPIFSWKIVFAYGYRPVNKVVRNTVDQIADLNCSKSLS